MAEPIIVNQVDDFAVKRVGSGFAQRERCWFIFGRRRIRNAVTAERDGLQRLGGRRGFAGRRGQSVLNLLRAVGGVRRSAERRF